MNAIETKQRSVLTDFHWADCLTMSLTGYTLDYEKLVNNMMTQTSH